MTDTNWHDLRLLNKFPRDKIQLGSLTNRQCISKSRFSSPFCCLYCFGKCPHLILCIASTKGGGEKNIRKGDFFPPIPWISKRAECQKTRNDERVSIGPRMSMTRLPFAHVGVWDKHSDRNIGALSFLLWKNTNNHPHNNSFLHISCQAQSVWKWTEKKKKKKFHI